MIKKGLIFLMIYSITRIVISCCNGVEEGFNFNYTKIKLSAGDKILNNIVNQSDSILYSDFIVQIDFDYTKVSQVLKKSSFDLYAFDCKPLFESIKKIRDLKVITIGELNNQHLSGSEVDVDYKVFGYTDMDFTGTKDFVIKHLNSRTTHKPKEIVYFKLKYKPTTNDFHRFLVNIEFDDNSILSDTTRLIYIKE
jgi:hypothetical protein